MNPGDMIIAIRSVQLRLGPYPSDRWITHKEKDLFTLRDTKVDIDGDQWSELVAADGRVFSLYGAEDALEFDGRFRQLSPLEILAMEAPERV